MRLHGGGLTTSRSAISELVKPSAIRPRISASRGVRPSGSSAPRLPASAAPPDAIAVAVSAGTLAFAGLGYAVAGMIGNADAAQPIVQATMLPLYFISGIWIPTDQLPSALRHIASIFPVEHLAAAAHLASVHGSFAGAFAPRDLVVLLAWAVGAAAFAARRFSWLPSAATT